MISTRALAHIITQEVLSWFDIGKMKETGLNTESQKVVSY